MARQRKITFELDAKNQRLKKKLDEVNQKLGQTKKRSFGIKDAFKKVFGALGIASFVATTIVAIKKLLGVLSDFDKGMRNVNSILGLSEEQFNSYSKEVLQVQKDLGLNSKELTDALYQTVSAGVAAGDAIAFLREAGKVGIAGVASTTEAVDILTTVLNAFHLEASESSRVSDVLFQTIKLGKTTLGELAASLAQVAPLAAANGIEFEQVSAAIATMTKQGVPTANAITQIRRSIISLNDVLGDGWTETMTYQEAVAEVAKQAGGSNTKLKEMLGRVEAVNAVLALTGENAQTATSDLEAMNNSLGAANDAFIEQSKSIERRWAKFTASITAGATEMADSILDMVLPIEKTQTAVQQLSDEMAAQREQFTKLTTTYRILREQTSLTEGETKLYKETIETLNKNYGNYLKNVNLEKDAYEEVQTALANAGIELDKYIQKQIQLAFVQTKTKELTEIGAQLIEAEAQRINALAEAEIQASNLMQQNYLVDLEANKAAVNNLYDALESDLKNRQERLKKELEIGQGIISGIVGGDIPGGSDKPTGLGDGIDSESQKAVQAIEGVSRALQKLPKVAGIATKESGKRFQEFVDKATEAEERLESFAQAIGGAFGQNVSDSIKSGLQNALIVVLDYLKRMIVAAQVGAGARAILGDPSGLFQIAGIEALFELLKSQIASFRTGVSDFKGPAFIAHEGELVTQTGGSSNVHTKTETKQLFDLTPLLNEMRRVNKNLSILQNGYEVIRGETVYKMYKKQADKRLSSN